MLTERQRNRRINSLLARSRPGEGGCIEWTGYVNPNGYGYIRTLTDNVLVHRVAYELLGGAPIPRGYHLHHRCGNPVFINIAHLEVLTPSEHWGIGNSPSATRARQTHCQHGHKFTDENTYVRANGHRRCRICHATGEYARRHVRLVENSERPRSTKERRHNMIVAGCSFAWAVIGQMGVLMVLLGLVMIAFRKTPRG